MSDFEPRQDPLDEELRAALRRRAGRTATPTAAAHDAVVRRAGAIRRRRVAVGGGGAMAVLLLGGILLLPRGAEEQSPAVTGDVLPSFDETSTSVASPVVDPAEDATPATVDLSIPPVSPETTEPTSTIGRTSSSSPTSSVATSSTASTSDTVAASSTTPSSSAPSSSAPTTSDTAPALAPFTNTYQSIGGSITVSWNGSALSLQAVSPASGFVGDVQDDSAMRVRVRFEGADDDSRIEVRVADGQVVVDID